MSAGRRRYPGAGRRLVLMLRGRVLLCTLAWLPVALPHQAFAMFYGVDLATSHVQKPVIRVNEEAGTTAATRRASAETSRRPPPPSTTVPTGWTLKLPALPTRHEVQPPAT